MALTTQQIQQVYLAITGRPAEGNAVAWASGANSVTELANQVIDLRKNSDFTSNDQFVNHLYQYLLNDTAPDAEGFAYWTGLLKGSKAEDGTEIPAISKAELIEQFINAVLAQNQTDHKYTLEAKTQVAVEFGNDVKSFVGGKQAEAFLKDVIFNHVDKNTTYADIEENATNFKGQYVNVASVTVQQGAEEATEGSETNATNYNATLDLAGEGDIQITGATDYADTLNLKVKGDTDNQEVTGSNFSSISSVKNVNIDMNNANAAKVTLATNDIPGVQNLVIKGSSVDNITVNGKIASLDTGASNDTIDLQAVVGSLQAGAGNDLIKIDGTKANSASSTINGGAGTDTLAITGDISKVALSGIEAVAGTGTMSSTQISGKSYTLGADVEGTPTAATLTVKATNGVDLSKLKIAEGITSTIKVDGAKSGTITLIKANEDGTNPITDTIALAATASKVNVKNIAAGDKLDVANIGYSGQSFSAWDTTSGKLAKDKATFIDLDGTGINVNGITLDILSKATGSGGLGYSAFSASATKNEALLFVTNTGDNTQKTCVYLVDGGAASASTLSKITLLATIDKDVAGTESIADNVVTFA